MNKKLALYFSLAIIILFIIFMVYDTATKKNGEVGKNILTTPDEQPEAMWEITEEIAVDFGKLKAVATAPWGILLAGDSFIALYSYDLQLLWNIQTTNPITAIAANSDTIYVSTIETILIFSTDGVFIDEWGPFDDNSIITSISASNNYVAFADAGDKMVFILNKSGAVLSIIGQPGNQFIIPSPYFDLVVSDDESVVTANPGKRSVEFRSISGEITSQFGEAGMGLEYFCGCCNPSHFALMPGGNIVTSEKGLNRIKIVDQEGSLVELVAQPDHFKASIPLDLAVNGEYIYAANPADSKLYIFKRK